MLTIVLSVVAYFFTGYTIGKVANGEYFDDTPTKELGPLRKLKRILLFPLNYHEWNKREYFYHMSNPMIRCICDSYKLNCSEEAKERYCNITTFLWPLKLIQVTAGIVELILFSTTKTARLVAITPSRCVAHLFEGISEGTRVVGRAKRKLLPTTTGSLDLSFQVDEITLFLKNIQKQSASLYEEKLTLEKEVYEINENLNVWRALLLKPDDPDHLRVKEIVESIAVELDKRRKKIDSLTKTINILSNKGYQLKCHATKLTHCKKTMSLGLPLSSSCGEGLIKNDSIAVLAKTIISSAQSSMAECQNLPENSF